MHEAVAVWRDQAGVPVDLVARRVWSEPAGPPGVTGDALFFPPPKELALGSGVYALPEAPVLCASEAQSGAADLLRRELTRMTGATLTGGPNCDIRLEQVDDLPVNGFRIQIDRQSITVQAGDRLGSAAGALAVVDAIGPDGRVPLLVATDWPELSVRPLYHSLNLPNRPDLRIEDYLRFVEQVVARGRYNQLHLYLSDAVESPSLPELARANAWTASEIGRLRSVCEDLGIELIPGVNAPGHTGWMLRSHPELTEDVNASLLDVRHPATQGLLSQHYEDVWTAFGQPPAMHIGHDEAVWQSQRWFGNERNPRNAATPRALLFADDLRFHLNWCKERGITPYIWTDMLLEGWNGRRDGTHRALELLTEEERAMLRAMAWSPLGDPLENLTERWGIPVLRVHTGYLDWKRAGLAAEADRLAGEGLGLFLPAPWASFAPGPGSRSLNYHLGVILLAGATAWSPVLEEGAYIMPTLAALAGHPAMRPGYAAILHRRSLPLWSEGLRPDASVPAVAWPSSMVSDTLEYRTDPRLASVDEPARWTIKRPRDAAGVSVLVAAAPSHAGRAALRRIVNKSPLPQQQAVGWIVVEHADGSETRRHLEYGEDIYAVDADPRANIQWRSADVVPLASPVVKALHPLGRDRRLYRVDLALDAEGAAVTGLRLEATKSGIPLIVGAASLLLR